MRCSPAVIPIRSRASARTGRPAVVVRALLPGAKSVHALSPEGAELGTLACVDRAGCFAGTIPRDGGAPHYLLAIDWPDARQVIDDAYAFGTLLDDAVLARFSAGDPAAVLDCLGAAPTRIDDTDGVRFAVWAPNAQRVSVVGDFNGWDGRRHPMRLRRPSGVGAVRAGHRRGRVLSTRCARPTAACCRTADPCARATEAPPRTASVVADVAALDAFAWHDDGWMRARPHADRYRVPWSIYEVHAESWQRVPEEMNRSATWDELAERLIPYVQGMGFTHVEFMPIAEYPFGGSWGYQPLAQFAPSARFGPVDGFARFVDRAHAAGIGVLVDWVPAHFPDDPHGLAQFDGTALYEHADPREGLHPDWHTCVFNVGRTEVGAFLAASALAWARRYHVDGIRVDAVASMLYRDYSRAEGEWVPNVHGGRENLESVAFLRMLNDTLHGRPRRPASSPWRRNRPHGPASPRRPATAAGFDFKWNMGWMHDTLAYLREDPVHRRYHHDRMTFSRVRVLRALRAAAVARRGRARQGSLVAKMPGDAWQRLATLRAYFGFMWAHPGKKLLFMGSEFAQWAEFAHDATPHWDLLDAPAHRGVQRLVRDLNRTYAAEPALHALDCHAAGFSWLIGDDRDNSVFAFARRDDAGHRWSPSATSRRCRARAIASACPRPDSGAN